MTLAIELGVYTTVSVMAMSAAVLIYVANRRFLEGELKRLMSWFVAAAVCIFFGAAFSIIYAILSPGVYASTMLIVGGLSMILAALFFIRAAFLLHDFSRVFGFADVEKNFDYLIEKGEEIRGKRGGVKRRGVSKKSR